MLESALSVFGILSPQQVRHDSLASMPSSLMEGTSTNLTLSLVPFIPLPPGEVPSSGSLESPSPQAGVLSRGTSQGTTTAEAEQELKMWCKRVTEEEETGCDNETHNLSGEGQIKQKNYAKQFWELISLPVPKGRLQKGRRRTCHSSMW